MLRTNLVSLWRYLRPILPPALLCALLVFTLHEPLAWWISGEEKFDQDALREWIREARINQTLPDLVREYVAQAEQLKHWANLDLRAGRREAALREKVRSARYRLEIKGEEIFEHLQALGNPPTKMYRGQLPLFPLIYRLAIHFDPGLDLFAIAWDSELPRQKGQYKVLQEISIHDRAWVNITYHLHAYSQRQYTERQEMTRRLWLSGLGLVLALLAFLWVYLGQRRQRERQRERSLAEQQMNAAERLRLQEELRRQEAERRHQEVERQNLELKSQLFANIGIMAGSYAHNIKNLLVRPNDLLRRCLEENTPGQEQARMLHEVRQTLGTVTQRLQQILQTVRRDPGRSQRVRIDLNQVLLDMHRTWKDLALEKWKLGLELELWSPSPGGQPGTLEIEGDLSHLQQALENLLFNGRDATFQMRSHLRGQARDKSPAGSAQQTGVEGHTPQPADHQRRQALIAAAAWKGRVLLRTGKEDRQAIVEVQDNGIGMSAEVRRRCTETHFSTKRDNALFAGQSAGMGLGLSFVTVILEHHQARLEIDSEPLKGTTFRLRFPLPEA